MEMFVPINILSCFWMVCISVFGLMFIIRGVPKLPNVFWNLISYGKVRNLSEGGGGKHRKRSTIDKWLDVPKQWFTHFYVVSVVCNSFLLFKLVGILFYNDQMPQWYLDQLTWLTSFPLQTPRANILSVVIAIALLLIQGVRRLVECLFVSSYSNSTIHVAHYILGLLFYALAGISILSEGPDIRQIARMDSIWQLAGQLQWFHGVGIILFFWATYHHHIAHEIFAGLRKGSKDRSHRIPRGDWFELVSCPHYLAEILIYVSLIVVLGLRHPMSYLIFGFTFSNQLFAGMSVHKWYQEKFDNYPKARKAVIPWLI